MHTLRPIAAAILSCDADIVPCDTPMQFGDGVEIEGRVFLPDWFYYCYKLRAGEPHEVECYVMPSVHGLANGVTRSIRGRVAALVATPEQVGNTVRGVVAQNYDAGHVKEITVNSENIIATGEIVSIAGCQYSVIAGWSLLDGGGKGILLDRRLDRAIEADTPILGGLLNEPNYEAQDGAISVIAPPRKHSDIPPGVRTDESYLGLNMDIVRATEHDGETVAMNLLLGIHVDPAKCKLR